MEPPLRRLLRSNVGPWPPAEIPVARSVLDLQGKGVFAGVMSSEGGGGGRTGLARALSKLGYCSRGEARRIIRSGRVRVNGQVRRDAEWPVVMERDRVEVDGRVLKPAARVYLMLNKPRGLVTTAVDEKGRATVFECLAGQELPFLAPVGRLDQGSEGLLLFTNDSSWAAGITDPARHLEKVYHVQIDRVATEDLMRRMEAGLEVDGELLSPKRVQLVRQGTRSSWLEVVLDEGKNRHIRRLAKALQLEVWRLVRISIGPLKLGELPKRKFRHLSSAEVEALRTHKSQEQV